MKSLRDARNRNWSLSLWEKPVKRRACNCDTMQLWRSPLIWSFGEQLLHNESVT